MRPTYFDLTVPDPGRARSFFGQVLGWRFEKFDMPYEYYRIRTGPDSDPGIDGGIGSVDDAPLSDCLPDAPSPKMPGKPQRERNQRTHRIGGGTEGHD